jgi:hypothetical protein
VFCWLVDVGLRFSPFLCEVIHRNGSLSRWITRCIVLVCFSIPIDMFVRQQTPWICCLVSEETNSIKIRAEIPVANAAWADVLSTGHAVVPWKCYGIFWHFSVLIAFFRSKYFLFSPFLSAYSSIHSLKTKFRVHSSRFASAFLRSICYSWHEHSFSLNEERQDIFMVSFRDRLWP